MAIPKRLLQEQYPILRITVPMFDDPKVMAWANKLEEQINHVLIRVLQQNQDRLLAALQRGTSGINTGTATVDIMKILGGNYDWAFEAVGDRLYLKYGNDVVTYWDGV